MERFLVKVLLGNLVILAVLTELRAESWPAFRGPTGQGISTEKNLPTKWSDTENVAWKTAIPGEGWSSPIVYADRIFVTTATDEGVSFHVLCLDRKSGKVLWNTKVGTQTPRKKRRENSYASPTPVTDGQRVYAVFGDGTITALDNNGKVEWTDRQIRFYSHHGLGASPVLDGDRFIMPFDGSSDGANNRVGWKIPWDKAVLLTLNKHTGKVVWRGKRGLSRLSHVTPVVVRGESGKSFQIVSNAGDVVQGFDPKSGERIWSLYSQGEGVTPSIVLGGGLIYSCSGFEKPTIRAIRPGGKGDVTKTHIAWEQTKGVPTLASMLYIKRHLFAVAHTGIATCYQADTGEIVWQDRIGGKHWASPIYADGKIHFLSEEGVTTIIEAGPKFRILGRNPINAKCQASVAVSQGQFFLRTENALFCLGKRND